MQSFDKRLSIMKVLPKIIFNYAGNSEDWGILISGDTHISVRKITSGINNGLICAQDCTEATNNKIKTLISNGHETFYQI